MAVHIAYTITCNSCSTTAWDYSTGGADERLSEYTGATTKAAPAGASTPGVRGPDPYEGGALTQDSRVSSSVVLDG